MASYYYIYTNLSNWRADKVEATSGDVTICSKKSVDNFVKGSIKLMVELQQPNLSKILVSMRDRGFIKNQNVMSKSQHTNNLEITYLFSCQKTSIVRTDTKLECGNYHYNDRKNVIVDGIRYSVEMQGEITCTELSRSEADLLCNNDPYLDVGTFLEPVKPMVKSKE